MGEPESDHALSYPVVVPDGPAPADGRCWVRFSLPLPRGRLHEVGDLALRAPSGRIEYVQTRRLADWPDGSARWLGCQAIAREPGSHTVEQGGGTQPEAPASLLERDGELVISNGHVALTFAAEGDSPISRVVHAGRDVAAETPFTCTLKDGSGATYTTANDTGRALRSLDAGPVSAAAEVAGHLAAADGAAAMSYRLRVRVFAGLPVLHMMLWVVHDRPGLPLLTVNDLGFTMAWSAAGPSALRHLHQNRYSLLSVPRDASTRQPVHIRAAGEHDAQIRVHNAEALEDGTDYPYYMGLPVNETQPYLGLSFERGWVACLVEDFIEKCPKGLIGSDNEMAVEMWPSWAGPFDWRQGRSRAMAWRLVFGEAERPAFADVQRYADATGAGAPAVLPHACYAAAGAFHADSVVIRDREGVRRLDRHLTRLMGLETPIGMWDLGDTRDPGYSRTYAAIGRLTSRDMSVPPRFRAGGRSVIDWCHPNQYEPVWSNNEYDVMICMAREIMRGGADAGLWRHLEWFGRHAIEVDFVHYSDNWQQHHGSPAHSASHDHASAYPSHLWSEGLLAYYCLTADDDALDVAVMTGDYIIRYFRDPDTRKKVWRFTRELGWALLHVATVADLTREDRFRDLSIELADFFLEQELSPALLRTMVQYAFGYASLVLGMEAVTQFDDRDAYRDWIIRVADGARRVIDDERHGAASLMNLNYLVPAYEFTRDRRYLETGRKILEVYLDSRSWLDPPIATKPSAMSFRGLSRFVHHAHNEGLLDPFEYLYAR